MGTTVLATLGGLLVLALTVLLVPTVLLLLQLFAASRAEDLALPGSPRPRLAVLMPAHNESECVLAAVHSVLPQLAKGDRLLVVADNCSDDTAVVAAAAGVEVLQRHDPQRRGKGYALDFGVRHLEADAPEVVVMVDADCTLGPDCLARLAHTCAQAMRPVQALYLMHSPPGAGLKSRLAELAWVVKNQARPLGYWRFGLPCQLMGAGMAFPWALIRTAPLASGHIVEDLQLGLELANAGSPPLFCPQAVVSSRFPADAAGLSTQRTRWEHGHLGVIASRGPRLLWRALMHGQPLLAAMVLDVCVPPLAALALLLLLGLAGAVVLLASGGGALPLALALSALAMFGSSILLAWWRFGRHIISLKELLAVPAYVLAKLPIYVKLFIGRQTEWVRTKRDDGSR